MSFDLAAVLKFEPEDAVVALKDASARLLLPVDIDRHLRERFDVLDAPSLMSSLRAYLDANNPASSR